MREIYYVYNNEAIASCSLICFLKKTESIDIARFCLILPFLLDDRTVNLLYKNQSTLEEMIDNNPRAFISFNKRYVSLLPTTINSLKMLFDGKQIKMKNNVISIFNSGLNFDDYLMGDRFNRITQAIPNLLEITKRHTTKELYKILRVQL